MSDTTPPVLNSIGLSTTSLNVGAGQTTLLVTARFTDDQSGVFGVGDGTFADGSAVSNPQIWFRSPSGHFAFGVFDILHPISGDRLDGVYQARITLGPNAEAGWWQVQYLSVNDQAGNERILSPTNSAALAATSFTVTIEPPTITSNGGGNTAALSIAENATAVTTVAATDPDAGQTLSYSISGGADASKFTIGSSTGALSFITAPNFEAPTDAGGNNVYDVIVQASDGSGGIDTQAIAVTVMDVLENTAPTFFPGNGKVTTDIGSSWDWGYSVTLQPDGKILVGGSTNVDFALVRYNADGSLDTSFDGDGKVTTAIGLNRDFCYSITLQPDGRILAAGFSEGPMACTRFRRHSPKLIPPAVRTPLGSCNRS